MIITEIISPYRIPVFNALARHKDVDLHVIFLAETDPTQREWNIYKHEISFSYQILPSWRRRYGKQNILLNRGLSAALEGTKPDVILCGGYNYIASWQAQAWAHKRDIPFLAWAESTAIDQRGHHKLIESLKKKFIDGCDGFVVPGKLSAEYIRNFDVSLVNIFTAPNAVDIDFFAAQSQAVRANASLYRKRLQLPDRFFLYVGRMVKEKGVFDVTKAYSLLSEKIRNEIGIVFVGSGPAKSELQERALELGLTNARFVGFAQKEELPYYYGLAEAFILPTHTDPWGLVVNEAMACGLPVIVTKVAGCSADLVEDRRNGFLIPAHEPMHLASILETIADDPKMLVSMGARSREIIAGYSPQICAAGIAHAALS
ncbi:MAG TPA: glycosyltransferase, partial [Candidatus Kapabacteria bacterium]|nr:glycosyltransferase [Candidatus Kapabacteria bacterium]